MKPLPTLLIAGIATLAMMSPAFAQMKTYSASLSGPNEVPANDSAGTGMAEVSYDDATQTITWKITYSGLTGDLTAAHFHGPAPEGQNAPPMVPILVESGDLDGSQRLNDEQMRALTDGTMYINLHTAQFPDGEIRGQVKTN